MADLATKVNKRILGREGAVQRSTVDRVTACIDINRGRYYDLQLPGYDHLKVFDDDADQTAILRKVIEALDNLHGSYELDPLVDCEYKKITESAVVRTVLISFRQRPGKPKLPVKLPAWAKSIEDVQSHLMDWNAGDAWAREVLGDDLSTWPATPDECKTNLDAKRIQPPKKEKSVAEIPFEPHTDELAKELDETFGPKRDFITIPLSQGKVALVDKADVKLAEHKWSAMVDRNKFYAHRRLDADHIVRMHRVILSRMLGRELNSSEQVDHINGDGLDNRRANLRLATPAENIRNRSQHSNNTSGYKGVTWNKDANKWIAQIEVNGKNNVLGRFDDPEEAYTAYCLAAKEIHGEFANLGTPKWSADDSKPGQSQNIAAWKHFERECWNIHPSVNPPQEAKDALAPYVDIPTSIEAIGWPATRANLQMRLDYLKDTYGNIASTSVDTKETTVTDKPATTKQKHWSESAKNIEVVKGKLAADAELKHIAPEGIIAAAETAVGPMKDFDSGANFILAALNTWRQPVEEVSDNASELDNTYEGDGDTNPHDTEPAEASDVTALDDEPPAALTSAERKSEVMVVDPENIEVVRESAFTGRALLPTSQEWMVQNEIAVQGFKSGLLKDVRNEFAARFIVETGRELGIPPSLALRKMNLIHGQISMAAELMWALVLNSGKLADFQIDEAVDHCTVTVLRKGAKKPYTTTFSVADAAKISTKEDGKTIKLSEKYNWRAMPGVMCKWRAISTACRTVFPDVTLGLYSREELEDGSDFRNDKQP